MSGRIKGSLHRQSDHEIDAIFIDRWSSRAMSGESLSEAELMALLEAARWAPSAKNFQPWRILYARRDTAHWPLFLQLLHERNQEWVRRGAALLLFVSKTQFDDGSECITHSFDTGAAWENFALQASERGLVVHGMAGLDYERARRELDIPDTFHVEAMAVVGRPGDKEYLSEFQRGREVPSGRRPLSQTACEGRFSF
jgi:nitroreductase